MDLVFGKLMRNHCKPAAFAAMLVSLAASKDWLPGGLAFPFSAIAATLVAAIIIYEAVYGSAIEILEARASQFSEQDYLDAMDSDEGDELAPGQDKFSD